MKKTHKSKLVRSSKVTVNPKSIVRVISKKNLLDLRKYEVREGYQFNQQPSDEFLKGMPEGRRLPVSGGMIHNGVEVRCFAVGDETGENVLVDMPIEMFFGLQQINTETRSVVKALPVPANLPNEKPRKGVDVYRLLSKAELVSLSTGGKLPENSQQAVEQFIGAVPENADVLVTSAYFKSNTELSCTAQAEKDGQRYFISIPLSMDRYFSLPIKVWNWPGWGDEAGKETNGQEVA